MQDWLLGHFSDAVATATAYLLFVILGTFIMKVDCIILFDALVILNESAIVYFTL